MKAVKLGLDEALVFGAEQGQVVEAGFGRLGRDGIGRDLGMGGGEEAFGLGQLQKGTLKPEFEAGKVKGVIADFQSLAAQEGGDLVTVALEGNGGGFGHFALVAVEESLVQGGGVGRTGSRLGLLPEAGQGRLADFGVVFGVVNDLQPGQERLVEFGQRGGRNLFQFGQEIGANEAEEPFNFAFAFGIVRRSQNPLNAEGGADGIELFGGVDLAPVDVNGLGEAIAEDRSFEAVLHAGELLIPIEAGMCYHARMIVDERKIPIT